MESPLLLFESHRSDSRGEVRSLFARDTLRLVNSERTYWLMATNPLTRTVRGMHFQIEEYSQRKLVTVAKGAILDVIINLRKGSSEFGRVQTFSLSADQHNALFIPTGFAHGYQTLVPETIVCYAIDAAHSPRHSRTVSPLSPEISPLWESPLGPISENDQNAIYLQKYLDSL